jgi:hypothetical protein
VRQRSPDRDAGSRASRSAAHSLPSASARFQWQPRDVTTGTSLGIRYLSRLGDDIENWAIFEGSEPYDTASEEITRDDPDLLLALETPGLVMA